MAVKPLPADKFRLRTDPAKLPFDSTAELTKPAVPPGQERALRALTFGAHIPAPGYHIYVTGLKGSGRHRAVYDELLRVARTRHAPADWGYVHNFEQPDRPLALRFTPGQGALFRDALAEFAASLKTLNSKVARSTEFVSRKDAIEQEFYRIRDAAFEEFRKGAEGHGLTLIESRNERYELKPQRDRLVLTDAEYRALDRAERDRIQASRVALRRVLRTTLEALGELRAKRDERVRELTQELAAAEVGRFATQILGRFKIDAKLGAYIDALTRHTISGLDQLAPSGLVDVTPCHVDLLVSHAPDSGAPVLWLTMPTVSRLAGHIEQATSDGSAAKNALRICAGALHHANGGFLLIDALELLQQRAVWMTLKDALRWQQIRIKNFRDSGSRNTASDVTPEPIPLDIKVVLFGEPWVFDRLRGLDPDFRELFKVQVEFASSADRDDAHCMELLNAIAVQVRGANVRHLDRSGAARLIDEAARQAGDGEKISVRTGRLFDLVREADEFAGQADHALIDAGDIERALDAREDRAGRLRTLEHELVRRRIVFIDTNSMKVGQLNTLTVLKAGSDPFGVPTRITATVGARETLGITIERITSKAGERPRAMPTLTGYMSSTYSKFTPLSLSASIVFEQCYGPIEGDSASAAELIAVLSAIADIPLRQSIGITGVINLRGVLQPVGAINQKIEGFFDICVMQGLSGKHGVIIPKANTVNLMLRDDVCDAARRGLFAIHPVEHINEAIEVLTGIPAGASRGSRGYPRNSVNRKVADALREMARPRILRPVHLDSWWT